jgi:multidrug efflux pump subunit AcrA (membrane-fusion protein)
MRGKKLINRWAVKKIFIKYKLEYVIYFIALAFILMLPNCAKTPEQKQLIKAGKKTLKVKLEGVVRPFKKEKILAPETGTVKKIFFKNGDWVNKGDVIYTISNEEVDVQIETIRSEINDINREINTNRRNSYRVINSRIELIRVAKAQLERIASLYAEGYATKTELESAEEKYFRLLAEKENIKENYSSKNTNLYKQRREKKVQLIKLLNKQKNTMVKATISGYLTGFSLTPDQSVSKGSVVAQILNLDKVVVRAGIASGLFQFIHKNDIVHIDFITTPPYSTKARITKVIPIVDPQIGRMVAEIELKNPNYILQDGTKALITLIPNKKAQAMLYKNFYKKGSKVVEIKSDIK